MTQEEKAKAYDEALNQAKFYHGNCPSEPERKKLEKMFPVLCESEDARIRKRLIEYFEGFRMGNAEVKWEGLTVQEVLAWLEKQKPLEWSDKDEKMKESIIKALYGGGHFAYEPEITWLKSLRPQSKQMISEDTEVLMTKLINLLKSYRIGEETATTLANRIADTYGTQRYMDGLCDSGKLHWKPSEEQMESLAYAIQVLNSNPHPKSAKAYQDLQTLYKNIKYGN